MQEQAEEEERLKRQEAIDGQYHSVVFYSQKSTSAGKQGLCWSMDPSTVFSTFDKDKLAKLFRHC